jgi:hypothetical protein
MENQQDDFPIHGIGIGAHMGPISDEMNKIYRIAVSLIPKYLGPEWDDGYYGLDLTRHHEG